MVEWDWIGAHDAQLRYYLHYTTAELAALSNAEWAAAWHHLRRIRQQEAGH